MTPITSGAESEFQALLMAGSRTYTVPLDDDGTGGVLAELHLTGEPVTFEAAVRIAEALRRATYPVPVTFAPQGPPPLTVNIRDAGKALGMPEEVVRRYVYRGDLPSIILPTTIRGQRPPIMVDGEPAPDPGDPRAWRLIRWDDLVDFVTQATKRGHYPVLDKTKGTVVADRRGLALDKVIVDHLRTIHPKALNVQDILGVLEDHMVSLGSPQVVTIDATKWALGQAMRRGDLRNVAVHVRNKTAPRKYQYNKKKDQS